MPRMPEQVLECVFYLYESEYDAKHGVRTGGTGFFVGIQSERFPERSDVYAVTCKHIVRPNKDTGFTPAPVIRLNTTLGDFDTIPLTQDDWYTFEDMYPGEKHDIAIHELGSLNAHHIVTFLVRPKLSHDTYNAGVDTGVGDDVVMVGRYIDHDGIQRNRPAARFGNISMMPDEDEKLPHWEGFGEVSYIVEMRSVSGYSGSPVYVWELGMGTSRIGNLEVYPAILPEATMKALLGIQWSQPPYEEYHREINRYVKVYAGMSNVIPAWYIDRMINWEVFQMHRNENDEKYAKEREQRPTQKPTGANQDEKPFTKEDFHEALRKASRPEKPDGGKS